MKRLLIIFCLISFAELALAQQKHFLLSGIIKDAQDKPIPGAGVYISGYQIATASNDKGEFTLSLAPGNYDLIIKMIGFITYHQSIKINQQPVNIQVQLKDDQIALNEVVVKPDFYRDQHIELFKKFFLGATPNAERCKIKNPEVLFVHFDKEDQLLNVSCNDFLIIENKALGYRIKYLITNFSYNLKSGLTYYEGYPIYEDLPGTAGQKRRWAEKRLIAYQGSPQHFFNSLYHHSSRSEGFVIQKIVHEANPLRPREELIQDKLKFFESLTNGQVKNFRDSLRFWKEQENLPKTIKYLDRNEVDPDTLVHNYNQEVKYINFTQDLYITYTFEQVDDNYRQQVRLSNPANGDYETSEIEMVIRPIYFYANGSVYNPRSMIYYDYWAWEKLADTVPMDYVPPQQNPQKSPQ